MRVYQMELDRERFDTKWNQTYYKWQIDEFEKDKFIYLKTDTQTRV